MFQSTDEYEQFPLKKTYWLAEWWLHIRQMRRKPKCTGEAGTQSHHKPNPSVMTHNWEGTQNLRASPWGVNGSNPASGTPTFKTCIWETRPQTTRAFIQRPTRCTTWETPLQRLARWDSPAPGPTQRRPILWRLKMKETYLFTLKPQHVGQAPNLKHIWEPAGALSRDGDCQAPSLCFP